MDNSDTKPYELHDRVSGGSLEPVELPTELLNKYGAIHIEDTSHQEHAIGYRGRDKAERVVQDAASKEFVRLLVEAAQHTYSALKKNDPNFDKRFIINIVPADVRGFHKYRVLAIPSEGAFTMTFRHIPPDLPPVTNLRIPKHWKSILTDHSSTGLYLFSGAAGQAKTTLASSTLQSRLELHGGYARTVEDPRELELTGFHGQRDQGYCSQTDVGSEGYAQKIRAVASGGFPAIPTMLLMVGEVLDAETARDVLLQSTNGLVVITTMQAQSVTDAMKTLVARAGKLLPDGLAEKQLSSSLRAVTHQTLSFDQITNTDNIWETGEISGDIFYLGKSRSVRSNIANGDWDKVEAAVARQRELFANHLKNKATSSVKPLLEKIGEQ